MIKSLKVAAFVASVAVIALPAGAWAQSAADIRSSMQTAVAGVKSFRMQVSSPFGGSSDATIVRTPLRMHMTASAAAMTFDTYYSDSVVYGRMGTGAWKKHHVPMSASPDMLKTVMNGGQLTPIADVVEAGTAYGAFKVQVDTSAIPNMPRIPPVTMTCTYDKKSFLIHDCKNRFITIALNGYNDPANVVTLPADLAGAADSQ